VRIARYTTSEGTPSYGLVEGGEGAEVVAEVTGDPLYRPPVPTGVRHRLDEVRLLAPVIPRSKVVCVGRNYAEHAAELGGTVSPEPVIFLKPNTAVIGPGDGIVYPPQTRDLHYEGELAVVIGRIARDVPAARVGEVVLGYTVANDVTARDLQNRDGQWTRAKSFDTFCPLGPWIVTDVDPADLALTTRLQGRVVQQARTAEMVHPVAALVTFISSVMTLLPGDVILTGTPAGVGPMQVGDEVSVTIEGIGTLTNTVVRRG
jgi:2-keto-4-pentenoate hydratase/2-oxohepta-3-ene-1,7-dioic acid hydratase in catechol pathway